ncbi:MAG: hypothetical protein HS103_14980 [Anaerolineales bacterium]|nr:hypothetical protein [Anaerolineales bacterium]
MITPVSHDGSKPSAAGSASISQVEKAKKYTQQPERVTFTRFTANFEGDNNTHTVTYENGRWHCTSKFFQTHGWSSHTVALERILKGMVEVSAPTEVQ